MTRLVLVVLLLALPGCARYYWSKPGSTAAAFARDSAECARQAAPSEAARQQGVVSIEVYRACLASLGYTRAKQMEPPPPGSHRGIE